MSTPSTGGVVPEKTAIVINDVHMDPSGQPLLFGTTKRSDFSSCVFASGDNSIQI